MKQHLRSLWTLLLLMMWCSVGFAQTTIWSEDWTGQKSDTNPSKVSSMYTQNNNKTRTYGETSAGGKTPELLLQKNDTWTVTISDLKGCNNSFTLSFKTNKHDTDNYVSVRANGKTISCPREGETSTHSGTFELNVATGKNLVLTFKAIGSNARIDDIKLTGTLVESKPTLTFSEAEKTVYKGSESSFTMPTLVLKDKDGKEVTTGVGYLYEVTDANPEGCLDVDMTTGKITFNKLGTANIKVTTSTTDSGSEFNNLTASFKLTYMKDPAAQNKLFFAETEKTIYVGKTDGFEGLSATQLNMSGAEVTPETIMYEAKPAGIVDVDLETGKIKSWLNTGTTTITATSLYDNEVYTASYILNYKKIETTLTLSKTSVSVNLGETPELPTCTLKAGDEIITNKALSYTITPEGIANIDPTTGELTLISAGKATVNVSFTGDETYDASNIASYDLTIVDPNAPLDNIVFDAATKGFDDMIGGSKYPSGTKNAAFKTKDGKTYAFSYSNCMRYTNKGNNPDVIQMRNNKDGMGSFTSPVFDEMPNGYKVNVYYGITKDKAPLTITSNEESSATSISNAYGEYDRNNGTGYCTSIVLSNGSSFTVKVGGSTCYVSKIEILPISAPITLEENATDTDTKIAKNNGKTQDVALTRTLVADKWNTFCVPFDTEIDGTALEGATVKTIGTIEGNVINLVDATKIEAGVPYLIMPTTGNIENPTFKNVTISVTKPIEAGNDDYKFVGTYSPKKITKDEFGTIWGVTAEGKLAKINADTTMKGLRAYFVFPTTTAAAKLNFDGETTGINNIETNATVNGKVYNLNGQYVGNSLNGLKKGIYVVNGKKVIK